MFSLCIVLLVFAISENGLVRAQECSSPNIPEDDWKWGVKADPIDASHSGTIIEYQLENTLRIRSTNNGFSRKYIDARLEPNGSLIIFTTTEFETYEDQETELEIHLTIEFECTVGDSTFVFSQPIKEANNHAPEFTQAVYEIRVKLPLHRGFDLTYYQELSARDIDLRNNEVTFESPNSSIIDVGTSPIKGGDSKTFFATLVLNQQLLSLAEPFNFTIIATDSDIENPRKSVALVAIIPDEDVTYVPIPRFEQILYQGDIDDNGLLSIADPTVIIDTFSPDTTFELIDGDSDLFSIEITDNSVKVNLNAPVTEEMLAGKTFLTATIAAKHAEVDDGLAVLLISLPTPPIVTTPRPTFEKSLVQGSIDADLQLAIEDVVLVESSYTSDVVFSTSGDDHSKFTIENNLNVLSITLSAPIVEEELEDREFYSFVVTATNSDGAFGETAILIALPEKTCEVCTTPEPITCPPEIECPECPETTECPTTTTEPPTVDHTPTFQNRFYSLWTKSNEFGRIGQIVATSPSTEAAIRYSLTTDNGYLSTRLLIDSATGEVYSIEELNSGNYEAVVYASITVNGEELQGQTALQLTVYAVTVCPDGEVTVSKSLAIFYLKENEIHENVFPTKIDDCTYVIRSVEPNDKVYVSINAVTNMLQSSTIDREDSIFADYAVPQIQIKLRLSCDEVPTPAIQYQSTQPSTQLSSGNATDLPQPRSIDPSMSDGRWYAATNDIDFMSDLTVINIIIEDVNDNYPIFDPRTPSIVGYPEPDIANSIIPSCLAVVHATDKDAGLNAKIKYTLDDNYYFKINPDSGTILPLSTGLTGSSDSIQLVIHATDNYGAEIGLDTRHVLVVKRLEQRHLTVVTVRDWNLLSSDEVIRQLNEESNLKMMILHSAVVPDHLTNRQASDDTQSTIKMIVYAFGDNNEPLETFMVQRELEPIVFLKQLTYSSYEDSLFGNNLNSPADILTWIIVVSVLASLIGVAVLVIFFMWWFKVRPYEFKTMIDESKSPQENMQTDFEVEKAPRESVNIIGSTVMESNDESGKPSGSIILQTNEHVHDNNVFEESEKRERRKSQGVTFNELVERIDIETDPVRDSQTDLRV